MNISELIKIIEDNKHDIKPMLRGIVYDPIYEITSPAAGAACLGKGPAGSLYHRRRLRQ